MFGFGKKIGEPEVTTDVPAAEAKSEGQKLEWGPELGRMSWDDAQVKITELNASLTGGEKQWRLPTVNELVGEFKKTNSTPAGFEIYNGYYWSNNKDLGEDSGNRYSVFMCNGTFDYATKDGLNLVRLVRDAA